MAQVLEFAGTKRSGPITVNGKVAPPRRRANKESRDREYLYANEIDRLMMAAKNIGRHGHRDQALIMLAYRHGLRVSEIVGLRWHAVDLKQGVISVKRLKNGVDTTHPLRGPEIRALRKLKRDYPDTDYVFVTERRGPMTASTVRKLVSRAGREARLEISVHPHMLRHSTGYKLANDGHDTRAIQHYMGHKNIQHTVRYTELSPNRFKDFWQD